jgi:hypothetical protein
MKYIFILALLATLASCSKDTDNNNNNERTLKVDVIDYEPPTVSNNYWAVRLTFNPQVTITGSVKVDFDVYNLGSFAYHSSQKFQFSLDDKNVFIHQTQHSSAMQGPEIKTIVVDSLSVSQGDYAITIK